MKAMARISQSISLVIVVASVTALILLATFGSARAADTEGGVPDGTLDYKIVFTARATTRSKEKNATAAKVLSLPMKAVANRETIHRVVTGSIRLEGRTGPDDPLADEARKKALEEEQAPANTRALHRQDDYEEAMRACRNGESADMLACIQRAGRMRTTDPG